MEESKPLKLEVGKRYYDGYGDQIDIVTMFSDGSFQGIDPNGMTLMYFKNGVCENEINSIFNLIEEVN